MKLKSIETFVEETNINFYGWQIIIEGFFLSQNSKRYLPFPPRTQYAHIKDDHGRSGIDVQSYRALGENIMQRLERQNISLAELTEEHHRLGGKIFELYQSMEAKDLSKASEEEFAAWFWKIWDFYLELNGAGMIPVASDYHHSFLSTRLSDILDLRGFAPEKKQRYLNVLMSPNEPNLSWHEQLELLQLVKNSASSTALQRSREFVQHLKKYEWLNYGYQGPQIKTEDFLARAKKLFTHKKRLSNEIRQQKNYFKTLSSSQSRLEKILKLNKREKYLFRAARIFTYLKGYRVDARHYFHFISDIVFAELARRFHLSLTWFRYAERPEILALLRGKRINKQTVLARRQNMLWLIERGGRKKFIPRGKIKDFFKNYVHEEKVTDAAEVAGQPAFLGKVQGRVKIVNSVNHVAKVNHGDILVSITTNPDLLPAMYRAIAFVTDTGGITSHAAIVSRELKKPCVIGTKFATKIFKDGDLVEVDANKGIVRKI